MNVPEKHRKLAHAWVDGAEIEFKKENEWYGISFGCTPAWCEDVEYRIKPKKVKKYQILNRKLGADKWNVSYLHYASFSDFISDPVTLTNYELRFLDVSEIEVEE